MRFLEQGADIPDSLIQAVSDGDAVFLCGVGVSTHSALLPLFDCLTKQVYERLNENLDNEPVEEEYFKRREYDRVLRSLERRTSGASVVSRVRAAVADILACGDEVPLSDHLSLLTLSRDIQGRVRLITTNFDCLFERAAAESGLDAPSYVGKSIPKPGGLSDYGIFHLHGRIGDQKVGSYETELILTSSDFGDAYLRDGWASRYIEDRMRLSILVLVGYQAEDAALRLLLEALDADRQRFRDLKKIYAIDKTNGDISKKSWKEKGIIPIEFQSFEEIYATLAEWARYASNPSTYSRSVIASILSSEINTNRDTGRSAESR